MEWGIAAPPPPPKKKSECRNPLEKFSPRFFGTKTSSFSLIIFQRAKLSTRSITHLCCCNWRTFWREKTAGSSPRGSCSFTTMPRLTGHLQSGRNWPTWACSILIYHPSLRIWPRRTTTCSLDWKKQLKCRHFSFDAEVIAAAETWLDGQLSEFFWVACKGYSNGLRCVFWASWGVCWINPEFGRCSFFPSWSGLGLISTPSYNRLQHMTIALTKK